MLQRILKYIRYKIDRYKLMKSIRSDAKEDDKIINKAYKKKFKYLGSNHILCSSLLSVSYSNILEYRKLFKRLSEFDMYLANASDTIRDIEVRYNKVNMNVNRFFYSGKEDPKKVYKETIRYFKLVNYKFLEYEKTLPNQHSATYLMKTRVLKYDFLRLLEEINKQEL